LSQDALCQQRDPFSTNSTSRDLYQFDQTLFSFSGNAIFANFHAARIFAQKMNTRRDLVTFPERAMRAGQINAMGLIDEIIHLVVERYRQQVKPAVMSDALDWVYEQVGKEQVNAALTQFSDEFPTVAVYRRELSLGDYLESESIRPDGERTPNRQVAE